jgi:hypothetical protein
MSRYTSAYSSFVSRLDEVEFLRKLASTRERRDPINLRNEINVFCRASIVLLSAHLEAYIKELGEVALTGIHMKSVSRTDLASRFYYHISKDMIDEVKDTADHDKIADKIFAFLNTDLSYWSRTGPFPEALPLDRFNRGFSNPAFDKIKGYFNRFGYSGYTTDLAHSLNVNYIVTINMVDHLVATRNKIAHGDLAATKTPTDVKDMVTIIRGYCAATDSVFGSWCKTNLCPIR